jgi:WD40 repeat protein/tRNA A-37 threonylcarbamoyl transferase component Bud32
MPGFDCVSEADLRALLLGELSEPVVRLVSKHLETCPECEAAAQRLDTLVDPFLSNLRQMLRTAPEPARMSTILDGPATHVTEKEALAGTSLTLDDDVLRIAGYEILGELSRGGMSVVYKARQLRPERTVALKMLLGGVFAEAERRARFLAEADAVARLRHPHIVQIHEVGYHHGLPFLSLEFMEGGSLAQHLGGQPLPPREAASLLETLARAVHYAHSQGVVHRDLKPANILLGSEQPMLSTESSARLSTQHSALSTLIPKISDFGLAKHQRPDLTTTGAILGTPSYMAPEQAAGDNRGVGPAADVYALGAILYETLTGRPPFQAATVLETLDQVETQEPIAPSQLQRKTPRDLSTICLKCLRKEPEKRYASAEELAEDLRRFRLGRPILARRTTAWERTTKWAHRHPALTMLLGLVAAVTVLGTGGVFWQWRRAEAALGVAHSREADTEQARQAEAQARGEEAAHRARAESALARAETALYYHRMALAERMWAENNVARVEQILDLCRPEQRGWEWHYLRRLCRGHHQMLRGHTASISALAFSADGRRLASAGRDGTVRIWDPARLEELAVLRGHAAAVQSVAYSPDGRLIASASVDRTVKLWDAATGSCTITFEGHADQVNAVAFSPDGRRLASASADKTARLWDIATVKEVLRFSQHTASVEGIAYSPDGRRVATASRDTTARIWDAATGTEVVTTRGHGGGNHAFCVAFSPDGSRLVSSSWNNVMVWDAGTGRACVTFWGHSNGVQSVAFTPDGRHVVSGSHDQTIKVWAADTGAVVRTFRGHTEPVRCVAVAPDGRVASGSPDRTIRLWDTRQEIGPRVLCRQKDWIYGVAFSPDGRLMAWGDTKPLVHVWDLTTGQVRYRLDQHTDALYSVAFSPDSRRLASAAHDGTVRLWDMESGRQLRVHTGLTPAALSVAFSPDGLRLAATSGSLFKHSVPGTARVWDVTTGQELVTCRGDQTQAYGMAFSPDGRYIAAGMGNYEDRGDVRVWETATGRSVACLTGHRTLVNAVAFSPDGGLLASASNDKNVRIWDLAGGRCLRVCLGHTDWVNTIAFTPDGRRLASAGADRTVRFWDTETGQQTLVLQGHTEQISCLAFSPDGRRLATCGAEGRVLLWDATPLATGEANAWAVDAEGLAVHGVGYTPDSHTLATTYEDGTVRVWDLRTGWEQRAFQADTARSDSLVFTGAGQPLLALATPDRSAGLRLLDAATGRERGHLPGPFPKLTAVALAGDGLTLATVETDQIRLWDAHTGEQKGTFRSGPERERNGNMFTSAALSPDGHRLAAGLKDGTVMMWDISSTAAPVILGAHHGAVTAMLFKPDGESLLSGGLDECVRFWDIATSREYAAPEIKAAVQSLALCPGRRVVAVGDALGLVRLLDMDNRRVLATLEGPTAKTQALAFAPDGETLCLGSASGTVKLWRVAEVRGARP